MMGLPSSVHTQTDSAEGVPEKAKDHALEQGIREINIAIDNQIEGYQMAVNEILRMKISNEGGKNEHFSDSQTNSTNILLQAEMLCEK